MNTEEKAKAYDKEYNGKYKTWQIWKQFTYQMLGVCLDLLSLWDCCLGISFLERKDN